MDAIMGSILTIDTGGTKTRLASFDSATSIDQAMTVEPLDTFEFPTPRHPDKYLDGLVAAILHHFPEFSNYSEENVVVIATTGRVNNGVVTSSVIGWKDFPLQSNLSQQLSDVRVIVGNDAKIGAIGAFAGSPVRRGLYVAIGTGIGGGMVIDGYPSADLAGMEIGKMTFTDRHESIIWEKLASGSAFYQKYGRLAQTIDANNPIWQEYASAIAKGLVVLLPVLLPDQIIIGGAMAEFLPKYGDALRRTISKNGWPPMSNVEIVAVADLHYTVNRGALLLALQQ